jgi:hypothetical protein
MAYVNGKKYRQVYRQFFPVITPHLGDNQRFYQDPLKAESPSLADTLQG